MAGPEAEADLGIVELGDSKLCTVWLGEAYGTMDYWNTLGLIPCSALTILLD